MTSTPEARSALDRLAANFDGPRDEATQLWSIAMDRLNALEDELERVQAALTSAREGALQLQRQLAQTDQARGQETGKLIRVQARIAELERTAPRREQPPFRAEFAQAAQRGASPDLVLVDEVVPEVLGLAEPATVREALDLDSGATLPGALLPGDDVGIRERVIRPSGVARIRVYGVLYRRPDGQEVLLTGDGSPAHAAPVPLELVLPYLAAVRGAGFPAPTRRLALLEHVRETHQRR